VGAAEAGPRNYVERFVDASLIQLQVAAKLPCSGISELALNSALAMIEAAAPRDEMEAATSPRCLRTILAQAGRFASALVGA
jgi:hypothetical protein